MVRRSCAFGSWPSRTRSLASLGGIAANAVGRPEVVAGFNYVYAPIMVVAAAAGVQFGIVGVATATALVGTIASFEFLRRSFAMIDVDGYEIARCLKPGVGAGLSVAVMEFAFLLFDVQPTRGLVFMLTLFLVGLASFVGGVAVDPAGRRLFGLVWTAADPGRRSTHSG